MERNEMKVASMGLKLAVLTIVFLSLANVMASDDVADIVGKHILAKGGLEAWSETQTMLVKGSYTAFSIPKPFVLSRARDDGRVLYHLDHYLGEKHVIIGHDGNLAWWINPWYDMDWAIKMGPVEARALNQDLDFPTPFFGWKDKGYDLQLQGIADFEGRDCFKISLQRDEESKETWFLDCETGLERARISQGQDFGQPEEQTTFFDDFRDVNGLIIPHYVESQFGIRNRVMEIESIVLNEPMDLTLFQMPMPDGMEALFGMVGEFEVTQELRMRPDAPWTPSETRSHIKSFDGAGMIEERIQSTVLGMEATLVRLWSYDRFSKVYRAVQYDDLTHRMSLFEGEMNDGVLEVSNIKSDTPWPLYGQQFHLKLRFERLEDQEFRITTFLSSDQGENWMEYLRQTYRARSS